MHLTSTQITVHLLNPTAEPVTGQKIGHIERVENPAGPVNTVTSSEPVSITEEQHAMLNKSVDESGAELSAGEKEIFYHFLISYADVLATSTADLGRTTVLRHTINTGDAAPIRQAVRRISPCKRKEIGTLLDEMLRNGVVELATSPWAAPIVLVQKKDGSTRLCVDYRKINNITCKDAHPLPRIDNTLDTLAGSQWFSTLDLLSGYWQVEIEETDRPKTAFCTTEGLYQFRVMPFGFCNAPATFHGSRPVCLQWSQCLVYLDDVIVLGCTFMDHLQNLQIVLQRLRESGLKLKPSKCCFFNTKCVTWDISSQRMALHLTPQRSRR